MSNNALAVLGGQQVSARLQSMMTNESVLGANVGASFSVMTFKGKVWGIKKSGDVTPLMRADGTGPMGHIDVVIVNAAKPVSKIFYPGGYKEGDSAPPDCWSVNGATPDAGASKKQSATCAGCPKNAWGSRTTEAGKPGKACADSKRLAIVPAPQDLGNGQFAPASNMRNEVFGGPMLLRIPAASLQGMKQYEDELKAAGFPYFGVVTRLQFDHLQSYPHILFKPVRGLTEEEIDVMMEMRDHPQTDRILNTEIDAVTAEAPVDTAVVTPPPVVTPAHTPPAPPPVPPIPTPAAVPTPTATVATPAAPVVAPAAPPPPASNPFAVGIEEPLVPQQVTQPVTQPATQVAAPVVAVQAQPENPYAMLPGEAPEAFAARVQAFALAQAQQAQQQAAKAVKPRTPPPSPVETTSVAPAAMPDTSMPTPSGAGADVLAQLTADLEKLV